jgi:hypothetical protein
VKLACRIAGKPGLIVGYAAGGAKKKIHAIVIIEGALQSFPLKEVELLNVPDDVAKPAETEVVSLKAKRHDRA